MEVLTFWYLYKGALMKLIAIFYVPWQFKALLELQFFEIHIHKPLLLPIRHSTPCIVKSIHFVIKKKHNIRHSTIASLLSLVPISRIVTSQLETFECCARVNEWFFSCGSVECCSAEFCWPVDNIKSDIFQAEVLII